LVDGTATALMAQSGASAGNSNVMLVLGILLFCAAGGAIVFGALLIGSFARPQIYHPEKGMTYECGEPAIGDSWVQFDLRFYTVALVFIVFDVEVALLWPWAVAFKELGPPGFWAFFVFFLLIAIPFLYEWKSGYLNWVRACGAQERTSVLEETDVANRGT
jgi:NADH-quinone oxidoreductase subunit A